MTRGYHLRISLDVHSDSLPATSGSFKSSCAQFQKRVHVPKSLFESLPPHGTKHTVRRNTLHDQRQTVSASRSSHYPPDYRFGPIRIDWVDFEGMDTTNSGTGKKVGVGKEREGNTRGNSSLASAPCVVIWRSSFHFRRSCNRYFYPLQNKVWFDQPPRGRRAYLQRHSESPGGSPCF